MDIRKRMILKILSLGVIGLIVLGYSIYREKNAPDPVPEIETVRKLLLDSSSRTPEEYAAAWSRAESSLMTHKKFDDVHRLNRIIRESEKFPKERIMLLDFSEYTAFFHAGKYDEALKALDAVSTLPGLAPEVGFALTGERMRVTAASEGIEKAMELFRKFRRENPVPPESSLMLCRTAVLLLLQYGKTQEAYALLTECASSVPEARKHFFLEQLGIFLVRLEKEPERKRDSLIPAKDISSFFTVSMAMADEYVKRRNMEKAGNILRPLAEDPEIPLNFRKMVSLKLNIMKEKQKK